jgi:hypothetical protein
MSIRTSFVKIWIACSYEFKSNFWIFRCLYHLLFDLETIGGWLNHHLMAYIWEKSKSILAENLNSGLSYLITTEYIDRIIFVQQIGLLIIKYN